MPINELKNKDIAIIGGGWYGCYLALSLAKLGCKVTIYERNSQILSGISGKFGIRLHKGPHYPRSPATRESCLETFERFCQEFPEFVVPHSQSIYALGKIDALGHASKVDKETFETVCRESPEAQHIDMSGEGYTDEIEMAMNLDEPSIILGDRLRNAFLNKLKAAGVNIVCNYKVTETRKTETEQTVICDANNKASVHDFVINATSYQTLIPQDLKDKFPVAMEVRYQPCLALKYKDTQPKSDKPFSAIVMDGMFPCMMPVVDKPNFEQDYILTHGAYTIMASSETPEQAREILNSITDDYIKTMIKPRIEGEAKRFWSWFSTTEQTGEPGEQALNGLSGKLEQHQPETGRFEYCGWAGEVLAKMKTQTEFRGSIVFMYNNILYCFPGKVSNVLNVGDEAVQLLLGENCITENGITYVKNGVLDMARYEIHSKPAPDEPNTCTLNTFERLKEISPQKDKQEKELSSSSVEEISPTVPEQLSSISDKRDTFFYTNPPSSFNNNQSANNCTNQVKNKHPANN
ncbi:FAD-dependent oxidoreductase [Legionella jordanis]|uniref:Bifunctional tRNA (Mnm(5)s(2)U34)-methyltransferase/FAD-dependent cmnm(5)s(2)U34 oxidoreductase n=1 Tax=Legionella jordanis TaxID=456 RepID=A0A0W0VE78_9GAMM|nr:FAD-dependent oxidoreductase [Legionella jordanis]KTD18432.1 bifunctional tRNA (mnm(5)s(2)U34)-methyltransferase/FAD-dependent cmnm(5)s(2)U34 oxidoreductase [Legionella jordanis]RMX05337.1 FAD-dependent oxidoreductase [Legionella jordanis]RMX20815.1 FAD-dependent oxidoreductase [Legionella jordanis]VEH13220.1 bifunctional tRNA (mnm(5)s(2)U34)-methyltransferase/FAD-dependent cmnm(5)s(2)U34 oxidoreductase [Legionella jordanis]HAT8715005.1 FAD-dependent oxidoreductase [Legionella jordanis]